MPNQRELGNLKSISQLLGPLKALATIDPPRNSVSDWERFLDECDQAGVSGVVGDEFSNFLGYALFRRWRWRRFVAENGLTGAEAMEAWEKYSNGHMARPRGRYAPQNGTHATLPPDPDAGLSDDDIQAIFDHAGDLGL